MVSAHTRRPRKSIVVSSALIYARPGRFRPFRFTLWPLTRFTWTARTTLLSSAPSPAHCQPPSARLFLFSRRGDFHTREFYALRLFLGPTVSFNLAWRGETHDGFPSLTLVDPRLNLPFLCIYTPDSFFFFFFLLPSWTMMIFLRSMCVL